MHPSIRQNSAAMPVRACASECKMIVTLLSLCAHSFVQDSIMRSPLFYRQLSGIDRSWLRLMAYQMLNRFSSVHETENDASVMP